MLHRDNLIAESVMLACRIERAIETLFLGDTAALSMMSPTVRTGMDFEYVQVLVVASIFGVASTKLQVSPYLDSEFLIPTKYLFLNP